MRINIVEERLPEEDTLWVGLRKNNNGTVSLMASVNEGPPYSIVSLRAPNQVCIVSRALDKLKLEARRIGPEKCKARRKR